MSRNRSQRRHNTRVHGQRRLTETNSRCSAALTLSGERCTCLRCETSKRNERGRWNLRPTRSNTLTSQQLSDYINQ